MSLSLRPYQEAAVNAVYEHLQNKDTNPCVVIACGCGKSVVLAKIATDVVEQWGGRVLVLAHVKELLEQNADKIRRLCPDLKVGIYSAGLKSRDTRENVIVAGIQSVYNKACDLGAADLIIVDECHLLNSSSDDSIYMTFLNDMKVINPKIRVVGLTATPYRLKGGLICKPENLLNEICYEAGLKEMIAQGYLSPLISRAGKAEANLDGLHIRGGEFIGDEVEKAMDTDALVFSACHEIAELTKDRKSVLIFCSSVAHCKHVAEVLQRFTGQECAVVTGDTPALERAEILERFKGNEVAADIFGNKKPPLKYLANVSVLTTGFDAPNTDCVVLLRPTNSPGLLIQMAGRGTRLSPDTGKQNCLFLDYGGNILRHGPLDMIRVKESGGSGSGDAPAKKCPQCRALIHAAYSKCPECGYEFPPPEKSNITEHASNAGVLSGEVIDSDYQVSRTFYCIHEKRIPEPGKPPTMRVDYEVHLGEYRSEWVCPQHTGYARQKFLKWWKERAPVGCPVPDTAEEAVALAEANYLTPVTAIKTRYVTGERFERITGYTFGPKAWEVPPEDWREQFVPSCRQPCEVAVSEEDLPF